MNNPYKNLDEKHFWKTAVSQIGDISLMGLYQKKWDITPDMSIGTAGSCFAQHIGKKLSSNGFKILDLEPPPDGLPSNLFNEYGYKIYSARFGNIYTVRQLLQLLKESLGIIEPNDYIWADSEGNFRDAFRPNIEPKGFKTRNEVVLSRKYHLSRVRKMFESLDIFIFTLGLTEAWINLCEDIVYPMAPGTLCGAYSEDIYKFHNFNFNEIYSDFIEFKKILASINSKRVKYLLTVSPVPLTATSSNDHVMLATVYSKSVLRAVVGELTSLHDDIDYFPSYEIITNPWSRNIFYSDNLRTVTMEGVNTVMRVFMADKIINDSSAAPLNPAAINPESDVDNVICEESMLEAFSKNGSPQ